jgi:hypothetical protein
LINKNGCRLIQGFSFSLFKYLEIEIEIQYQVFLKGAQTNKQPFFSSIFSKQQQMKYEGFFFTDDLSLAAKRTAKDRRKWRTIVEAQATINRTILFIARMLKLSS